MKLDEVIIRVCRDHPNGIKHAALVTAVLRSGYDRGQGNLSEDVHTKTRQLVRQGVLTKNPDDRTIRPA